MGIPKLILVVALVTATLAASIMSASAQNQAGKGVTFPELSGRYAVGRTSYFWVDSSRDETLTKDPNAKRELMVWLWYPAQENPDAVSAPYIDDLQREALAADMHTDAKNFDQIHVRAVVG